MRRLLEMRLDELYEEESRLLEELKTRVTANAVSIRGLKLASSHCFRCSWRSQ